MPTLTLKTRKLITRTASSAISRGRKLSEIFSNSLPVRNAESIDNGDRVPRIVSTESPNDLWQRKEHNTMTSDSMDFLDLLEKLQSGRLDDQRCDLPTPTSLVNRTALSCTDTSIFSPSRCRSNWIELESDTSQSDSEWSKIPPDSNFKIDDCEQETAHAYRLHFSNQEHYNFAALVAGWGPVVMSIKREILLPGDSWRIICRLKSKSTHELVSASPASIDESNLSELAKAICKSYLQAIGSQIGKPILGDVRLIAVDQDLPQLTDTILAFDEHAIVSTFKFGVVSQKKGQTTENELFGNQNSQALDGFLEILGNRILLKGHTKFSGGLDTVRGQTGDVSFFVEFQSQEIMFHVSALLPFNDLDSQHLERKRHIGNDIVVIIFQEDDTPFLPSMITSSFIHVFIVVQEICPDGGEGRFMVRIFTRDDVPEFGPPLPNPPIFSHPATFRQFLLAKLINAELACYKARKFLKLQQRTRESLLENLLDDLQNKSEPTHSILQSLNPNGGSIRSKQRMLRLTRTFRKFSIVKPRNLFGENNNQNTPDIDNPRTQDDGHTQTCRNSLSSNTNTCKRDKYQRLTISNYPSFVISGHPNGLPEYQLSANGVQSFPGEGVRHVELLNNNMLQVQERKLSIKASPEERCIASPHNLNPPVCTLCADEETRIENHGLKIELNQLKLDKLELLRINLESQKELKKIKLREVHLLDELSKATKEVLRLRNLSRELCLQSLPFSFNADIQSKL